MHTSLTMDAGHSGVSQQQMSRSHILRTSHARYSRRPCPRLVRADSLRALDPVPLSRILRSTVSLRSSMSASVVSNITTGGSLTLLMVLS